MNNNENIVLNILKSNKFILFEYLKVHNIRYTINVEETSIRTDSIDSNNYNGLSLSLNTMTFYDFKNLKTGNVLDLLELILNKNKLQIIFEIQRIIKEENYKIEVLENHKVYEYEKKELLNYPIQLLDLYNNVISDLFLKDGIKEETQIIFDIRHDKETDRVLIPVIFKEKLVGIIGRYNNKEVPKKVPKYYPILVYPKSEVLFGYDLCKNTILKNNSVILVESEKSVMKSIQVDFYNTLAVGGSNVSNSQIELLKELNFERVFICFDSDKDKLILRKQIQKWFSNIEMDVYLVDNNTKYIYEKSCIFDMNWSKEKLLKYIKKFSEKVK